MRWAPNWKVGGGLLHLLSFCIFGISNFLMQEQLVQSTKHPLASAKSIREYLKQGDLHQAVSLFQDLHATDQVLMLLQLEGKMRNFMFSGLTHKTAGTLLSQIDAQDAMELIREADPVLIALWLDHAGSAPAAHIIRRLPAPFGKKVLAAISNAEPVVLLMKQSDNTAGGLMTPEFVAIKEWNSVKEALDWLRNSNPTHTTTDRLFVVDMWNRLTGVVSLSDMVVADPNTPLRELMDSDVIYVAPGTGQKESARLMLRYNITNLPVTDESGTLLGAIAMIDVMSLIEDQSTKDMYRLAAFTEPERIGTPLETSIRNRLPWLVLNLITIGLGTLVISLFESTISKIVVAAAFIPVVASQGGVGGAQTIALMVRGLALGDIDLRDGKKALAKEFALGLSNGLFLGVLVGLAAFFWKGSLVLGVALGLAMTANMMMAGISGVLVPLGLKFLKVDPALASMVFVTTITDVCGFLLFLGLVATLLPILSQ